MRSMNLNTFLKDGLIGKVILLTAKIEAALSTEAGMFHRLLNNCRLLDTSGVPVCNLRITFYMVAE